MRYLTRLSAKSAKMGAGRLKSIRERRPVVDQLESRLLFAVTPVINEFLAQNTTGIADENGTHADWLEIHNPDTSPVDLSGYYLTDKASNLTEWQFPAGVVLGADSFLLVWASGKDRRDPAAPLHTNFKLSASGEYLGLVEPDGVTVVSDYAPFPAQTSDVSYGIDPVDGTLEYFATPTPGAPNTSTAVVATPQFSQARGFYDTAFNLTLSSATPGATIRYTTDGSAPTSTSGTLYTGPISITTTTDVRAIACKTGGVPSPVATESYIFLNDVIHQPASIPGFPNESVPVTTGLYVTSDTQMDPNIVNSSAYSGLMRTALTSIPTLAITAAQSDIFGSTGFYHNDVERPVSVELIDPAHPDDNSQINGLVQPHADDLLKRSLQLSFKPSVGPSKWDTNLLKDAPLNGSTASDTLDNLILRAGHNRAWSAYSFPSKTTYTEDEWYRASMIAMDGIGSHGTFVQLYLNGVYWGLYNVAERPDENFQETYFGGDQSDYFSLNSGDRTSGSSARWDYLTNTLVNQNMAIASNYDQLKQYLDVSEFSDYLTLSWFQGMTDWPSNNWFAGNRNNPTPTPIQFYTWDGEGGWDISISVGGAAVNGAWVAPSFRNGSNDPSELARIWRAAKGNSDFMTLFADRVYKATANDGALTDANSIARWDTLNNYIKDAVIGESARWGDALKPFGQPTRTRDVDWEREVNAIRAIMNGNDARFISALRAQGYYPSINPATFNQRGGLVNQGFNLVLTNPNSTGTIYYTTDGTDPRLSGGGLSPNAIAYSGPVTLNASANIFLRVRSGSTWSAADSVAFTVSGISNLRITELMYDPPAPTPPDTTDAQSFEYVELQNTGGTSINLSGAKLAGGVSFTFGDVTLPAGGFIVVVKDLAAFTARYGMDINVAGEYTGKLANEGESLQLIDKDNNVLLDFAYSPAWFPDQTNGQGYSLVIVNPLAAPTSWSQQASWQASTELLGDPGTGTKTSAPTTTSVKSNNSSSIYGQAVTFTATVAPTGIGNPGGTVQFEIDGTNIGFTVALSGATATFTTSTLTAAKHTITAIYSGDLNFLASTGMIISVITPRTLTGSVSVTNKVYDGTTVGAISSRSLTGVVAGDAVALAGGVAKCADNNVGTKKSVTVTGLTLTGAAASNYVLSNPTGTTTANITVRSLVVTANNFTRVYGQPNPAFTATISGLIAADGITSGETTSATQYSPGGTYAILPALKDPNHRLSNYAVTIVKGTLTVQHANTTTTVHSVSAKHGTGTVTLTAAVSANSPSRCNIGTGHVTFIIEDTHGNHLRTVNSGTTTNGTATAKLSLSGLAVGSYSIVAVFVPDPTKANLNASTSAIPGKLTIS